jgi:predicted PhzF superfamily epimerase YddE/YHI9
VPGRGYPHQILGHEAVGAGLRGGADRDADARAGLGDLDLGLGDLTAARWSAGNPFSFVPVRRLDAMRRCVVDLTTFDGAFEGGGRAAAFLC